MASRSWRPTRLSGSRFRVARLPNKSSIDIYRRSAASNGWRASPALSQRARAKGFVDSGAAAPLAVVPQYALGGSELDGARIDAQLSFPAQIKKVLTQLRVGPPDYMDGREVDVVQGTGSRGLVATLYFDKPSGLLVRMVRF